MMTSVTNFLTNIAQDTKRTIQTSPIFQTIQQRIQSTAVFDGIKRYMTIANMSDTQPIPVAVQREEANVVSNEKKTEEYLQNVCNIATGYLCGSSSFLFWIPMIAVNRMINQNIAKWFRPAPEIKFAQPGTPAFDPSKRLLQKQLEIDRLKRISNIGAGSLAALTSLVGLWNQNLFTAFVGPCFSLAAAQTAHLITDRVFQNELEGVYREVRRALPPAN